MKSNVPLDIVRPPCYSSENQGYHLPAAFVHAGVAIPHDQVVGANISSIRRTYLVEEFIDEELDGFVKFVHNDDANPLLDRDDPFYNIAEFLGFTRNVQYFKMEGPLFCPTLKVCMPFTMIEHYSPHNRVQHPPHRPS